MKKLFSLMMVAVVALLASVSASAFTITFNLDNAGSAVVEAEGTTYDLHAGANELTFDFAMSFSNITVKAVDGWKLVSVVSDNPSEYGDLMVYGGSASSYFYLNQSGRSYTISTVDLTASRTAQLTVNIIGDPSTVQMLRDNAPVTLQEGENTVKFDPENEAEIQFRHTTYDPFYKITCNGDVVPLDEYSNFAYTIHAEDGDAVVIEPSYPDVDVTVSISCNIEGAITSVMAAYTQQEWKNVPLTLKAGTDVFIYFNDYYKINGVTCNGDPVDLQGTYVALKVGIENMDIVVNAEEYAQIPFTLNIDDPARVGVWPGTNDYGTAFELVAGANSISVNENTPSIYIRPIDGNYIISITDGEGNEITPSYNVISPITEGMVINVTSAALVNDSRFVIYFDGPESTYSRVKLPETGTSMNLYETVETYAGDHYWIFPFCAAAKQEFSITLDADPTYDNGFKLYYFVDNELKFGNSSYMSGSNIIPVDGQVVYGFAAAEEPSLKAVTFTVDDLTAEKVQVFKDIINEVADWQSGVQAFPGTLVTVKGSKDILVKVDDTPVEATEDGLFKIVVSADKANNVEISHDSSSIIDIEAEGAAAADVYNLQGIRVASSLDNLPAGIYIQGGKKVIKK